MPAPRQLRLLLALGLWVTLTLAAAFVATWRGFGGRALAFNLIAFAILLAGYLLPAAAGVTERLRRMLPHRIAWLAALPILAAYAIYAVGTGSSSFVHWGIALAYVLVPLALLSLAEGTVPDWHDYLALVLLAVPAKLHWLSPLWPYPDSSVVGVMTALFAMNVAIVGFLFIRRLDGVGYLFGWSTNQITAVSLGLAGILVLDVPLGLATGFLHWAPGHVGWSSLPLSALAIFFFVAWPEEFVFRGLLQNMLSRTLKSQNVGWIATSVIFGLAHIGNGGFPNWRYVLLATIAGIFYGWTWRKTGSIFGAALVHCAVDTIWHALFA
jgi:membrane protease YdiL (CAAX protease family)